MDPTGTYFMDTGLPPGQYPPRVPAPPPVLHGPPANRFDAKTQAKLKVAQRETAFQAVARAIRIKDRNDIVRVLNLYLGC